MTEMTPAEAVFFAAVALPAADRAAYLARACAGNDALRQQVERMLAARAEVGDFLEPSPPADATGTFAADAPTADPDPGRTADHPDRDEQADTVIAGRYRLTEKVGEGGMGSVWVAHQSEPVRRKVAVKFIKAGMDSKTVLARFEAERQALAVMDHPNIAKVLDGGLHEGRPFFVMELVKGVPITQFCDERRLTPAQRLELFVPVCQAIQHAHQKGIIHRDVKPNNVLVALYDDKPVPKVIDFGIAKATGGTLTEHTIETAFGGVVGTPQYMSPEQASLNNLDIDTRSDVYSLGVLLYELLTGSPPFARKELEKRGLLEILRVVREDEPPRPSVKLSTADALPSLSASRGTEPKKLTGLLRNELDWIVMKALEKDRTRRYETANGFAADVQRYLSGETVQAHPPSTAYRVKKFVRRNKVQVLAASLVLLALLLGIAGTTRGLVEARRQERAALAAAGEERQAKVREAERAEGELAAKEQAERKRQEAETQQRRAEAGEKLASDRLVQVEAEKKRADEEKRIAQAVKDFLQTKLLAQADTATQANQLLRGGRLAAEAKYNPTIKELLDRAAVELAADKIEANFPGQPLVQAEILKTVGVAYLGIGEAATSLPFLTRSADLFRIKLGPDHSDTLSGMSNLAIGYLEAGKLDLALPLIEETFKRMKANLGPAHPFTLTSMNNLAGVYWRAGKLDLALPLLEEAVRLMKAKLGPEHTNELLLGMNNLAMSYHEAGKVDQALPLFEETLRLMKTKLGPDHPDTLTTMNNLAAGYEGAGKPDLALPLHEETLRLTKAKQGPDHPDTLRSMNNLANCYANAGKLDLALPLLEETFKLFKAKLRPGHPHILVSMNNLAMGYVDAGKVDQALPLFEESFKLMKANPGPDHPDTLTIMHNLAGVYRRAGKVDQALPLFEELLPLQEKKLGRSHPDTQTTVGNLGRNYKDADRLAEALPLLEEAYRSSRRIPTLRGIGGELLDGYVRAGKRAEGVKLIGELLADARKTLPKDSPELAVTLAQTGLALLDLRRYAEAEPLLREGLAIREKKEPDAWTTFNTQSLLGAALLGQKKYADAEPLLLKGYEGMKAREKAIPPQGTIRIPESIDRLIELSTVTSKPDEAKKWRAERAKYPNVAPPPREKK